MLPGICGSCPACGSEDVRTLSVSRATHESFVQCEACGEDWWEEDQATVEDLDEKEAA